MVITIGAINFAIIICAILFYHHFSPEYDEGRKYKTFARRFWAGMTDVALFSPITDLFKSSLEVGLNDRYVLFLFILSNLGFYIYTILTHAIWGQTLGKRLCRVKVVRNSDENSINFNMALLRDSVPVSIFVINLLYMFSKTSSVQQFFNYPLQNIKSGGPIGISPILWVSTLWFLCEVITMLTNDKRRAVHDFIAGTVVVRV